MDTPEPICLLGLGSWGPRRPRHGCRALTPHPPTTGSAPLDPEAQGLGRLQGGLSWRVQLQSELVFVSVQLSPGAERLQLPYTTPRGGKGAHMPLIM